MSSVTRDQVIEVLERIAILLELQGENPFKVRAYHNGARALEMLEDDLGTLVREDKLKGIPGIGEALREKISTLVTTGKLPYYDELVAQFPPKLFELFDVPGLGPKKIKALYEKLNVASLADLEKACKDDKVAGLDGFGAKTQEKLLQALDMLKQGSGRHLSSVAAHAATTLLDDLRAHPDAIRLSAGGSTRRRNETVHDIDIIVSTKDPAAISRAFREHPLVASVIAAGDTKSSVMLKNGLQADLRVVSDEEYPFALMYFTGSKEHNIVLRGLAQDRGWTLNEYRLAPVKKGAAKIPKIRDERDIYELFGFDYVEPELRENRGELEAAEMLRKHLGIAAERAARNGVDGASDLDTSMTFWKWEVKRYARLGVESIMQRAELDQAASANRLDHTALLMRADDCEWLIVLRLHDVPQFLRDLEIQRLRDP